MVGDGVVAGVVDVDDRSAAVHLLDRQRRGYSPQGHIRDGPLQRVVEIAVHARLDAAAPLAFGLVQLLGNLPDRQDGEANVVDRAHEEASKLALVVRRLVRLDRRHRQIAARRVSRHEIADARSVVGKQAPAVARPPEDLGGVLGMVGHQEPAGFLLVPAEARDDVGPPVQDAGLARRRGRGQQRRPGVESRGAGAQQAPETSARGRP